MGHFFPFIKYTARKKSVKLGQDQGDPFTLLLLILISSQGVYPLTFELRSLLIPAKGLDT